MYIRRATIKSRKDGSQYYSYRLVESRRTEKGVKQYTLLNLGVDFSLPREQWPDLTKRVEAILCGQQSLFEIDVTCLIPIVIFAILAIVRFRVFLAVFPISRPNRGRFPTFLVKPFTCLFIMC